MSPPKMINFKTDISGFLFADVFIFEEFFFKLVKNILSLNKNANLFEMPCFGYIRLV